MASEQLELLHEVGRAAGAASRLTELVERITHMTQQTLKGSASSVLVFDEKWKALSFVFAEGEAATSVKRMNLDAESGVAGWVARHGRPLMVNDVKKDHRFNSRVDEATGFVTRSILCAPLMIRGRTIGSIEVLNRRDGKDFDDQDLETLVSVASTVAMAIENTRLHQSIVEAYKGTIKALAGAIDARDRYTLGHSQRVMSYALVGGKSLSLPTREMEVLEWAGILHDIGKIGISDTILCKPSGLNARERTIMSKHSEIGASLLRDIPFLEKARPLVLHHHERYDGHGYPHGLSGEEIPMGARLIFVSDAFDTMTTERPYRKAVGLDDAVDELRKCSGTQFCPVAVEAFVSGLGNSCQRVCEPTAVRN